MKKKIYLLVFLSLFLLGNIQLAKAQCVPEHQVPDGWQYTPYFVGNDSYITLRTNANNENDNFSHWLEGHFSFDMWVKCNWPADNGDNAYWLFSAGPWDDDYNSLHFYFEKTGSNTYRLRIGDGNDAGGNDDLFYPINYGNDYYQKWVHLTVTYDDSDLRLYVNGALKSQKSFVFNTIARWHADLGGHGSNHTEDFRGYISGFRFWRDHKLTNDEVQYIYPRTFTEVETMTDDMNYLHSKLAINMYCASDNIYSITPDGGMAEHNINRTSAYHPGRTPKSYGLVMQNHDCDYIDLNWDDLANANVAYYVYRKQSGQSGTGQLLCRSVQSSYRDSDPALAPGQDYVYTVIPHWKNPDDSQRLGTSYYSSPDTEEVTASLRRYAQIQNLMVVEDAGNGNCNGQIELQWDALDPAPGSYYIDYKVGAGNWTKLIDGLSNNNYTYDVPAIELGRELSFRIDGAGDGCVNFSQSVVGTGNEICTYKPDAPTVNLQDDNILIEWTFTQPAASATAFRIYRSIDGGSFDVLKNDVPIENRSFTDAEAQMCVSYRYKVEAYNACGATNAQSDPSSAIQIPVKFNNVFTYNSKPYFDASKGYYNQKVELEWKLNPDKKPDVEVIEIYRRKVGDSFELLASIDNANATKYSDLTAEANQMYEYLIRATGHCGVDEVISDSLETLGFRTNNGIISGKITFEGGNAVRNVEVRVSSESPMSATSLSFNGLENAMGSDKFVDDSLYNTPVSVDAWIKPNQMMAGNHKTVFSIEYGHLDLTLINMRPTIILNSAGLNDGGTPAALAQADTILQAGYWYHLAMNLDPENGKLELFLNGELADSATFAPIALPWGNPADYDGFVLIGAAYQPESCFSGNIDEVRLWKKYRSPEIIKRDYQRLLPEDEEGLAAYWHFDENYGEKAYDISKQNGEFSKNDLMTSSNPPEWSPETPSFEQLHPAGVTDDRGNYTIEGIKYTGSGNIFNITPALGVHEFDPTDINLYISDNTPVHNNIDFTDISSFRVTGTVLYENTTMPLKDAFVKIDGQYVQGENNQAVQTDINGQFDIQVPIGKHYISIEKANHTFVSAHFPRQSDDGEVNKHYFNEPIYGLKFHDNTLVKLAGKVVGGSVEEAKTLNSNVNPTTNNLGVCEIVLTTQKGYMLQNGKTDTTIYTDANTGTYAIDLCPEAYKVTKVRVNSTYNFLDNEAEIIDMSNSFVDYYTIDSIENDNGDYQLDTVFTYNRQKDWIWRSSPLISVLDQSGSPILGDSLYIVRIGDPEMDTIQIANNDNGTANYVFGKPSFSMEQHYVFLLSAYELYTNSDDPGNEITDTVPVTDGQAIIVNDCAYNTKQLGLNLNDQGLAAYEFWGGSPNMSDPYTKKIEIKLKVGDYYYDWAQSPLMAYVSGHASTGNNFITEGPQRVDFVLRDPPGSNSYAYTEAGLEITRTQTKSSSHSWSGEEKLTYHMGTNITTSAGSPVFQLQTEIESSNELSIVNEHSMSWGDVHESVETLTFNESYSTSDSPDYVGAMADLFLGHSVNIIFGLSNFMKIYNIADLPEDAETFATQTINGQDYAFAKQKGLSIGEEFSTTFAYTQNHIENYLIPNIKLLRNLAYSNNMDYYTLNFTDPDNDRYLSNNDDERIWGNEASGEKYDGPSYTYNNPNNDDLVDSVRYYNNQINAWIDVLAQNEKAKLKSVKHPNFPENLSFDAGANYEASLERLDQNSEGTTYEGMISPGLANEVGFSINNKGFSFEIEQRYTYQRDRETVDDTVETQSVGFVLADEDQGDYFSVDVRAESVVIDDKSYAHTGAGYGPIFRTQGGQSSCPYEDAVYTKYYKPGSLINQATMQIEVPEISVNNNIIAGVPETDPAVFQLALANNSEADASGWYMVFVDPASNPNGAVVKMDGAPISGTPKAVMIESSQTVYKTITVSKGQQDVNNYDSLAVIMHSPCQFDPSDDLPDIADTVFISAHFSPSCTAVEFDRLYDNWTANIANNDTLSFNITGYNVNSSKFENIKFQFAAPGAARTTQMTFYKDEDDYNAATGQKTWINSKPSLTYNFPLQTINDGNYQLYLKTTCDDGSEYITTPLNGVVDRITPKPYGTPQPADGVLSAGEDISITLNETINSGDFYTHAQNSYIELRGILNGTDLKDQESLLHDASLHFDGIDNHMKVKQDINLNNTSFTLEFWAKRDRTGRECLLALGDVVQGGLWIGFNASDQFVFRLGDAVLMSDNSYTPADDWAHYACVFEVGDEHYETSLTMYTAAGATTESKQEETDAFIDLKGWLYAGYCQSDQSAFMGNMHDLRLWTSSRTFNDINKQKSQILSGYESGLVGLWPMNEASGQTAHDLAMGRNGEVNATWQVSRNGHALDFDGSSYAYAPTASMVFDKQTDFTLEFWFKTATTSSDMCLFSNGSGTADNAASWTVKITENQQLVVNNNSRQVSFDANPYLNNQWQHFALTVNRLGYLSVYVNSNLMKTASASPFEGFGSSQMVLGAHWWREGTIEHIEDHFTGVMDEIRVWNSCRSQEQLNKMKNTALNCDEPGLKAYFAFEDVNVPDPSVSTQTLANMTENKQAVAGDMQQEGSTFTVEAPRIRLQRPVQSLPFNCIINNDQIVITPDLPAADIENTVLDISVKGLLDTHNNRMGSTVNWTAFIDQNQVVWEKQELTVEKQLDDEVVIETSIINKGGANENFEINNIPAWMEVSPRMGNLDPQESRLINLTIKPEVNIGTYKRNLQLVSSMGFNERHELNLKVKGQEPNWTVNPADYDYSANLIGQLSINGLLSTDTDDMVAAFIDGQCRGVASLQYFETGNLYLIFMDIYDNQLSGKTLIFKVYDASTGEIYTEVEPALTFEANKLYGSVNTPVAITATTNIEQSIALNKGWNWLSFNVYGTKFNAPNDLFANMEATASDAIKSNTQLSQFSATGKWEGPLNSFNHKQMYKLKVDKAQTLTVSGQKVLSDTVAIPIVSGWNWLAYPLQQQLSVQEALAALQHDANDILKSQQQFAVYDPNLGWIGSLTYLKPGQGYMLKATNNGTLTISGNQKKHLPLLVADEPANLPASASNMTMVATPDRSFSDDYCLKAYQNGQMCGYAKALTIKGKQQFFITMNAEQGQQISFKADNKHSAYPAEETFTFYGDAHYGSLQEPVMLHFKSAEIIDGQVAASMSIYPNPCTDKLMLTLTNAQAGNVQITLFDMVGVKHADFEQSTTSGYQNINLSRVLENLSTGMYMLKLTNGTHEQIFQLVKAK